MNYRVIENYEYEGFYEDFKEDYLNAMPIKELMEKYDIGKTKCWNMGTKVRDELGLDRKPKKEQLNYGHRFIRKSSNGRWQIFKTINGKKYYYGTYDDLDTAIKIRDRLISVNWDKSLFPEIRDMVLLEVNLK